MPTFNPANVMLQDAKNGEIPTEQGTLVMSDVMQSSAIMQLAQYEEMTKPKKEFTYLADGPGAYWVGEAERIQTSKATWLTAEMEAKKLGVILPVSKEFLNYSVSDFFAQMRPHIAEAFYTKFDQAALFGNESPYVAGNSVFDRATAAGNVIEQGTNATLYQDLAALIGVIEDGDNDPNGFTTTRRFKKDLRNEVDAQNRPIFNDERSGVPGDLLGEPINYVNRKSFDEDKAKLLSADWSFARYGILQGIQYSISEDATLTTIQDEGGNPVNLFERDMFALRATMHVGFMTLKDDAFGILTAPAAP